MTDLFTDFIEYLYLLPAILISLSFHECAHAFVATKLGDPTPKEDGRLSLNPFRHIDIFGFVAMLVVHFGWAKPVRVNPIYFENPRKGMLYTAIAGPISNVILGVLSSLLLFWAAALEAPFWLIRVLLYMVLLNVGLAIFNLIPIHPFDGSRVLTYFSPRYASFMASKAQIVQAIFLALLLLPQFLPIPNIIGNVIGAVQYGVLSALLKLWSMLFWFV